jgi:hypothetical protein
VHHAWLWVLEVSGSLNSASKAYNFWSGFGSDLGEVALAGALAGMLRRHNCHQRRCWRIGRHKLADPATGLEYLLCRRHHPAHPGRKPLSAHHFHRMYELGHRAEDPGV